MNLRGQRIQHIWGNTKNSIVQNYSETLAQMSKKSDHTDANRINFHYWKSLLYRGKRVIKSIRGVAWTPEKPLYEYCV